MICQASEPLNVHAAPLPDGRDPGEPLEYRSRPGRWLFVAVCVYLLAQSFNVPIVAIGPSWALWPALPDFAIGLVALAWLKESRTLGPRPASVQRVLVLLFLLLFLSIGSYAVFTLLPRLAAGSAEGESSGVLWGAYGLVRLVQVVLVFMGISQLSLDAKRCKILVPIVSLVHMLVSASIIAVYFSMVTTADLSGHIPSDPDTAGAWNYYHRNIEGDGLGGQGYNHGYVACQVMLLFVLRLHLSGFRCGPGDAFFLLLTLVAVFLTRSRAGFACMAVLAAIYLVRNVMHNPLTLLAGATVVATGLLVADMTSLGETEVLERQLTAFQFYERENLSGRDEMWSARVETLNQEGHRWFVGGGFGTAPDYGQESGLHSHNLALHVISETGLVGLIFVAWFWWLLLGLLWSLKGRALFWGSFVLLLFSLSYEVFYPIPAMQHFLSFFMAAVAIGLRTEDEKLHDRRQFARECVQAVPASAGDLADGPSEPATVLTGATTR